MLNCRRVRGQLAAALYDDLKPAERYEFDAHLSHCAACAREFQSMKTLLNAIPAESPSLGIDLMPALRGKLRAPAPRRRLVPFWTWNSFAAAAAVLVITVFGVVAYRQWQPGAVEQTALSPLQQRMQAAERMVGERDYAGAFRFLQDAVNKAPNEPESGLALARCAEISFRNLNWYPESFELYERLAREYPGVYAGDPDCIARHNCLIETRDHEFAPLYALDAARRGGDEQFARLEKVVGQYPGTFVAAMAVEEMAKEAAVELASKDPGFVNDTDVHLAALVCAKDRCNNPIAAARLKLEVAHIYVRDLHNPVKAKDFYREVLESGDVELAGLAQECLAHLDDANSK